VSGLSRLLRGYSTVAVENIPLWHERDISHSSVERVIWSDAFNLAHYMTGLMKRVIDGLVVNERMIRRNLDMTRGLLFSGRVLLALVERGMSREDAYAVVQDNAMKCWDMAQSGEGESSLLELLRDDARVAALPLDDGADWLGGLFDMDFYLRYVDEIFSRFEIFGPHGINHY
jgi:adenylosuccinate lyase